MLWFFFFFFFFGGGGGGGFFFFFFLFLGGGGGGGGDHDFFPDMFSGGLPQIHKFLSIRLKVKGWEEGKRN